MDTMLYDGCFCEVPSRFKKHLIESTVREALKVNTKNLKKPLII